MRAAARRPAPAEAPPLDGELVCVDLETTGGSSDQHRVIEVGIVRLAGGAIVDEWSSLVNPGTRIPPSIEAFTGITNDMVAEAPRFADLADRVQQQIEGRLFVAHNARFDYGFLRREFQRLGRNFRSRVLCSVKLSRRLHPEQHGHGLDAVMARHGLGCTARHRALGDARVVAEFLRLVRRTQDPAHLAAIVAELTRAASVPSGIEADLVDELPEVPGVYRFWGAGGSLLYVGRSRNLRSRVLAHFAAAATSPRERRLSTQLQRLDWTETAGEFGAMLLELQDIRQRQPLFNRRSRPAPGAVALLLREDAGGLRPDLVGLTDLCAVDDAYGVFRSERDARRALGQIVHAHGLCARVLGLEAGSGSCFAHQVGRCRGVCAGLEPRALHDARVRLALAPQRLRRWPFAGRIALVERAWDGRTAWHVFGDWRFLGTVAGPDELENVTAPARQTFDIETYRVLCRVLDRPPRGLRILQLDRA